MAEKVDEAIEDNTPDEVSVEENQTRPSLLKAGITFLLLIGVLSSFNFLINNWDFASTRSSTRDSYELTQMSVNVVITYSEYRKSSGFGVCNGTSPFTNINRGRLELFDQDRFPLFSGQLGLAKGKDGSQCTFTVKFDAPPGFNSREGFYRLTFGFGATDLKPVPISLNPTPSADISLALG